MRSKLFPASLLLCALTVVPATSRAADSTCGGLAPLIPACSFTGTLAADNDLFIDVGVAFTGSVVVTITSESGRYDFSCTYYAGVRIGVCSSSQSGVLLPGQIYILSARAGVPLDGRTFPAAAGRWQVALHPAV